MGEECCAHLRISYRTKPVGGGAVTGWWECDSSCGAQFLPSAARARPEAGTVWYKDKARPDGYVSDQWVIRARTPVNAMTDVVALVTREEFADQIIAAQTAREAAEEKLRRAENAIDRATVRAVREAAARAVDGAKED